MVELAACFDGLDGHKACRLPTRGDRLGGSGCRGALRSSPERSTRFSSTQEHSRAPRAASYLLLVVLVGAVRTAAGEKEDEDIVNEMIVLFSAQRK